MQLRNRKRLRLGLIIIVCTNLKFVVTGDPSYTLYVSFGSAVDFSTTAHKITVHWQWSCGTILVS
jgi:hypothetical protein